MFIAFDVSGAAEKSKSIARRRELGANIGDSNQIDVANECGVRHMVQTYNCESTKHYALSQ